MSENITKTPVSVLQEMCKRKHQPSPVYTFSEKVTSGFDCTVTAFDETKEGQAKSMKKAKQAAAENLIKYLRTLESFKYDLVHLKTSLESVNGTEANSTSNGKKCDVTNKIQPINYVGKLLEYCAKKQLPPAQFELVEHKTETSAQSQLHEFEMKCRVSGSEKQGKGSNKKQAKQTAAMEMLKELKENNGVLPSKKFKSDAVTQGSNTPTTA